MQIDEIDEVYDVEILHFFLVNHEVYDKKIEHDDEVEEVCM